MESLSARRPLPGGPRDDGPRRPAREPVQQRPLGRPRLEPPLGQPVPEPVGDRRRRGDVLRHLDPQHVRAVRPPRLEHDDERARVRDVERAPRPLRGAAARRRELGAPRAADRGGAGRERVRPAARDPGLEPDHDLEPPRLPGDQQRPAVSLGGEAHGLEGHPLPERPLLQQQQGFVRHDGVRRRARRGPAPARVRLARRLGPRAAAGHGRVVRGAGAGGRRRAAGGRVPQHLRGRHRSRRGLLLRRRALAADPSLVGDGAPPGHGRRRAAVAGEPRLRHGRQPARHFVRGERHGVRAEGERAGRGAGAACAAGGGRAARPHRDPPRGRLAAAKRRLRRAAAAPAPLPRPRRAHARLGDAGASSTVR